MNALQYAAANEAMIEQIFSETGYERKTTFFGDLSIAEFIDKEKGVRDTYKRVIKSWNGNIEFFTEFVMCLNHKLWQHYERGEMALAKVYDELWREADELATTTFKGKDLEYYYRTTD